MLISEANRTAVAEFMLDLEASLFAVCILHLPVHCAEVEQHARRQSQAAQDIRKHRRSGLGRRETDADLTQLGGIRGIPGRQQRIGKRAQWHAIVKQSRAQTYNGAAIPPGRPGQADARRDIVFVGGDRFQELQVVSQPGVESQVRVGAPFILRVKADVRIGLCDDAIVECLRETGVVIRPAEEIRE